jgi:hypothetical protein
VQCSAVQYVGLERHLHSGSNITMYSLIHNVACVLSNYVFVKKLILVGR